MSITDALAYLILVGGVAVIIVLLSLLMHGLDYFESGQTSARQYDEDNANENKRQGDPVASAIASYDQRRDAHERDRSRREAVTIRVFTATGGFALAAVFVGIATVAITHNDSLESNKIALESFTAVQRAFLTVRDVKMIKSRHDPTSGVTIGNVPTVILTPVITNSGHTPAVEFSYSPLFTLCNLPVTQYGILGAVPITTAGRGQVIQLGTSCFVREGIAIPPDPDLPQLRAIEGSALVGPGNAISLGGIEITETALNVIRERDIHAFIYSY